MSDDPVYLDAVAAQRYPALWQTSQRAAFVAGAEWFRTLVQPGGGTPAEIKRRRDEAVREAFPHG